jgi:hypothetical protein
MAVINTINVFYCCYKYHKRDMRLAKCESHLISHLLTLVLLLLLLLNQYYYSNSSVLSLVLCLCVCMFVCMSYLSLVFIFNYH